MTKKQSPSAIADYEPDEIPTGSIADGDPDVEDVSEDATGKNFKDFSVRGLLEGRRPNRRAVVLYLGDGDDELAPLADVLRQQIRERESAGLDVKEQQALLAEATDALEATGQTWVVEARSPDWHRAFRKRMRKAGVNPAHPKYTPDEQRLKRMSEDEKADLNDELWDALELYEAHLLAEQVVIPSDVTHEDILAMNRTFHPEYQKLGVARNRANSESVVNPVTPDFSRTLSKLKAGKAG